MKRSPTVYFHSYAAKSKGPSQGTTAQKTKLPPPKALPPLALVLYDDGERGVVETKTLLPKNRKIGSKCEVGPSLDDDVDGPPKLATILEFGGTYEIMSHLKYVLLIQRVNIIFEKSRPCSMSFGDAS